MIRAAARPKSLLAILLASMLALGGIVALPSGQPAVAQTATALGEDFDYFADFSRSQVLTAASSNAVIPASGEYTVEAWIKPRPFTGSDLWKTIVSQNQVGGGKDADRLFLSLYWTGSKYQIHIGYGTPVDRNFDFSGGVPTDSWSHIALTVAGSTNKVFFNGVEIASYTAAVNAGVANAPFTVGATGGSATHHFDGGIDQVKVWNGALTAQEVQTSMHTWAAQGISGKTLKAHYDFNNRSAANSVIFDKANRTTSGNHLSITGELAFKDVKDVTELNGRQIFSFPRSYLNATGGFRPPATTSSVNALVVGGGGAGGFASEWSSGGGGGGEVRELSNQSIIAGAPLRIQVAQGGVSYLDSISGVSTGGQKSSITQISGQNPTLLGESRGGGSGATSSTAATGFSDGFFTGGGGSAASTTQNAAAGDSSNAISRDGSSATSNASVSSQSGGGGAGSGGSAGASSSTAGGAGGVGTNTTLNEFFGFTYGGGGGGGRQINSPSTPAAGGSGGGGTGGIAALAPTQGLSNTGGGGGGAGSFRNKAIDLAGNANSVLTGPNGVIPAGKFTIEAWVLLRSNNGVTILSEGDASPGSSIYIATLSGGNFYVRWGADGANAMEADTGYNAPVNTWTHIALTRSSTGVAQFFVNGVSRWVSTSSSTSAPGTTNPFRVGAQLGNVYYLNGSVDGLKIWDENLSASELEVSSYSYASTRADGTPIKAGATLRALYDFNSFTPPAEVDKSGNNRDLTYGSAISAESFVGNNDFVGVAGANGGSGLVVVSVPLRALCVYNPSGFALMQDPKITLRPLAVAGPSRVLVRDQSVAAFFGEPVIVNGKLYIPDRGRGLLRRMNKDGSDLETVGSLPTPGQGAATDGRYVYATTSTSIARFDTVTGIYEQNFIGKGNIAHVDGEIAFARFNGVGYLFIANNNYNVSSSTAISRIHAVPVSGAAVPTAINNTIHLFSESRFDGIPARSFGSSGLAVVGNNVYWNEFNPTFPGNTLIFRKEVRFDNQGVPTNLPSATAAPSVTNYFADQFIHNSSNSRAIGNDGTRIFVNEGATIVRGYDTANNLAVFAAGSVDIPNAGGFLPTAECSQSVQNVQGSFAANQLSVNWLSPYGNNASVRYLVEYRMNGGNWIFGIAVAGRQSATFSPAGALSGQVEVRVTTDTYTQLSEFSYSGIIDLTPPPPPPLCADPMRLEFDVPANTTVTLPFTNGPVSTTVTVRWAQGADSVPITWTNGNRVVSHTFATAGVYPVQVCGQFTGLGSASVLQPHLTKVLSWGQAASSLTSLAYAFRGAGKLIDVPNTLPSGVTTLQGTFFRAEMFNDPDVSNWVIDNVTNLGETFNGASAFNQNLGSWNTANVTTLITTFAFAAAFNNGGSDSIKDWNTANVTNLFGTFNQARSFNQPIGTWDVSRVTNFVSTFDAAVMFNQPLANWNTGSATNMNGMFNFAQAFNQNIGTWDTADVTNFRSMFSQAIAFNNGGTDTIKNWNTAAATNMSYMFFQASVFNQPLTTDGNKWNVANVSDMQFMFGKARAFNQDLTTWNVANVTNMNSMFWLASAFNNGSAAGTTLNWNTLKVTNMNQMFFYAGNFKRVLDFEIDALTTALEMLSFSGLSDDQYGLTISDFENQFTAGGARTGVSLGATDKTALCNTPQDDLLKLVAATGASGAGWTITDKTIRTAGHCTPQVTITAKAGSHVYGNPLPAIGYDIAVTSGSLPTSDWLNDVTCRAVAVSGGAAVTTTSAAAVVSTKSGDTVSGTYKTVCSGPTGTGLGINVTYKDNVYGIAKRPITVRAVDQAVFAGQATLSESASSSDSTPRVLVTAGSILSGDVVNYSLSYGSPTGSAAVSAGAYTGDGTFTITPFLSTGQSTANYEITPVTGTLSVTTKTYIISARTQTKLYGDQKSFSSDDWTCVVKVSGTPATSEPCTGSIAVALSSAGASSSAAVNGYAITVGDATGLPDGAIVEKVNGNLIVKKRPIIVTANSKQVAYGAAVPTYDFTLLSSEFRNGNGANTITGITCSSQYVASGNGKSPRGTVLPITCSGGTSDFYELVYVAANLTVLEDSQVASDVPQEIRLAEDELSTTAAFAFNLTPVNEICFANLVVNFPDGTSRVERVMVIPGSPVSFSVPLDIGEYDYSLAVDGNCSIPQTSGNLRILEYVAPEPQPEPQQNPSSNPVLLPSINSLSERQLAANQPAAVSIRGERLNMVTEITVGGVKIDFTINLDGSIRLSLPALRAGTYDMVVFHSYGSLSYPGAFTIGGSSTPISGGQTIPSDNVKSRTLRFTNLAGDGFRLPSSARSGITRVFTAIGDVDRVVCRGLTSARRVTPADQRLAENRAREACNLAQRLAPTASIELRTSPAAGVGPRFRAVNLFIVYSLD